jgi:hypothetical protein
MPNENEGNNRHPNNIGHHNQHLLITHYDDVMPVTDSEKIPTSLLVGE